MNNKLPGLHPTRIFALRLLAFVVAWAGLLFGALQLLHVPMPPCHALCGAGGWLPPTNALVSVHLFWLMLDTQATFDLVCADSSCGCFDRRLAGDGHRFSGSWPVDDGRDRQNVRFPVGSLYGLAADPTGCCKCCRVAEKQTSCCQRFRAACNRISTGGLVAFDDVLRRDPCPREPAGLTTSDDFRYNVLVVNNGSTETTLALIKRPKPTITQRGVGVLDSSSFEQSSSSSILAWDFHHQLARTTSAPGNAQSSLAPLVRYCAGIRLTTSPRPYRS